MRVGGFPFIRQNTPHECAPGLCKAAVYLYRGAIPN
jgi:hypothetical protein